MGKITAICISQQRGTPKHSVPFANIVQNWGIEGDAHAGDWPRQISLLSKEKIDLFRARGAEVSYGSFGENLVIEGIDLAVLPVGNLLSCGSVLMKISQIGKKCHNHCEIFQRMGECIMPDEGVFVKVLHGGKIKTGDKINLLQKYNVAIITSSDSCYAGLRKDESGLKIRQICTENGYEVSYYTVLPDERKILSNEMKRLCNNNFADLILTTGGTGFSSRDCMPEATLDVIERTVPGIPEAIRNMSASITPNAMLSRAVAGICGQTLIVNLPGSPKAVEECLEYILAPLRHGLDILTGKAQNCAR